MYHDQGQPRARSTRETSIRTHQPTCTHAQLQGIPGHHSLPPLATPPTTERPVSNLRISPIAGTPLQGGQTRDVITRCCHRPVHTLASTPWLLSGCHALPFHKSSRRRITFIHALIHAVTRVGARPHHSILGMGPSAIPALCTRPPHPRYAPRYGPAMLLAADSGSDDPTRSYTTTQTKEQHRLCHPMLAVS
ncbi:hypothetical protein BC628DRAFT_523505 [Trametes gibbosa]|nr:hypothetical protein BC628DRAFT_523505 [Trametes gibbosa]